MVVVLFVVDDHPRGKLRLHPNSAPSSHPTPLNEPASKAWAVADLYRDMARGARAAADPAVVAAMVQRCRSLISAPD